MCIYTHNVKHITPIRILLVFLIKMVVLNSQTKLSNFFQMLKMMGGEHPFKGKGITHLIAYS